MVCRTSLRRENLLDYRFESVSPIYSVTVSISARTQRVPIAKQHNVQFPPAGIELARTIGENTGN